MLVFFLFLFLYFSVFFFFNDTATTEIYTLSLHDALPILSQPVEQIRIGESYRYQPKVIRSMGDLQDRYEEPELKFWDQEHLRFSLEKGPDWLSMDSRTGLLTGTPSAGHEGKHPVLIGVTASFEKRTGKDKYTSDLPDKKFYQAYSFNVTR